MPSVDQPFLDPEFLSVTQAAKYLSVSAQTLRRWDESGKLPSLRHAANGYRYYRRSELERFRLEYQVAEAATGQRSLFETAGAFIDANPKLREPQRQAHGAVKAHYEVSREHVIVQLPVGCGKTGVIATLPFGVARGRALVIAPNVTIRNGIAESLDPSNAKCFWRRTGVLESFEHGPFTAVLDGTDANIHDCVESHFVVTNIQQLASSADRWLPKFPPNFFDMILVDEGHHNAAPSWRKVFERFPQAKVVSLTATPFRGDQRQLAGDVIYRFPFTSAMAAGFIKKITATNVVPTEIFFTYRGEHRRHTLDEVLELREEHWFSRGVALSEECNVHIVEESMAKLAALRTDATTHHQMIAAACSVDHARQIRALYEQRGLRAHEIHSAMPAEDQERILERLKRGNLDCIVQVQMLGEGFDHPPLSVAAVFRPFRSLSPYIQFVGRIMRVNVEGAPDDPANHGYVVSHVGLNNDAQWDDFRELDLADQELFRQWVREQPGTEPAEGDGRPRRFDVGMQVTHEILGAYVTNDPFLDLSDDRVLDRILATPVAVTGLTGLTIGDLVPDREALRARLRAAQPPPRAPSAPPVAVTPQRARQAGRKRLADRSKSVANRVLSDLVLAPRGYDLVKIGKGRKTNLQIAIELVAREVNAELGRPSGSRGEWSRAQVEQGLGSLDAIGDRVRDQLRAKVRRK